MIDVCIPKVNSNMTETTICDIISSSQLGEVIQYIEIPWKEERQWKRVLLKIKWNQTHSYLKERLVTGQNIKIVYDAPWFWLVYLANFPI